jgi:hypothetical protein
MLNLEDNVIIDASGEWLHVLVHNNLVLESINFALVGLDSASVEDLALSIGNCKSLVSIKIGEIQRIKVVNVSSMFQPYATFSPSMTS